MIITTTPSVEGKPVRGYLGVVTGEAIMGANIRDIVGGRSDAYEQELRRARDTAIAEMEAAASQLGANVIRMVTVSGMAVKL